MGPVLTYECTLCRRRGVVTGVDGHPVAVVCGFCGGAGLLVAGPRSEGSEPQPRCRTCDAIIGTERLKAVPGTHQCKACAVRERRGDGPRVGAAQRRADPGR